MGNCCPRPSVSGNIFPRRLAILRGNSLTHPEEVMEYKCFQIDLTCYK